MSRIGKSPIAIPAGVTVTIADNVVTVKGKLGELSQEIKEIHLNWLVCLADILLDYDYQQQLFLDTFYFFHLLSCK